MPTNPNPPRQPQQKQDNALTLEDIKRIAALPRQKLRIGNVMSEVVIDPITRYIYFPNPHPKSDIDLLEPHRTMWSDDMGNIEDVIAEAEARKREEEKEREKVEKRESKKHRKQDTEDEHKEKGKDNAKPKGKQKLMFGIVLLALIVGGGVVAAPHLTQNLPINNPKQPAGDTAETEPPVVGETSSIVQVVKPLIPGDVITDEDLQEAVISTETYNQITLQGTNLYAWQRHETLVGMYVQEYIPAGQYVSFASVGAAYDAPQSLWKPDSYIDIPLTEEQSNAHLYQPGEKVKIVIRTETLSEAPETGDNAKTELSGGGAVTTIKQQSSINETQIPSTTVCDVLTGADGEGSMFQTLSELSAVPAGEQADYIRNAAKKEGFFDKFNQKYLRIYVSESDATAIGDISNSEKTTITIEPTGEFSKENDARATFVSNAQATLKNVQAVIDQVFGEEDTK